MSAVVTPVLQCVACRETGFVPSCPDCIPADYDGYRTACRVHRRKCDLHQVGGQPLLAEPVQQAEQPRAPEPQLTEAEIREQWTREHPRPPEIEAVRWQSTEFRGEITGTIDGCNTRVYRRPDGRALKYTSAAHGGTVYTEHRAAAAADLIEFLQSRYPGWRQVKNEQDIQLWLTKVETIKRPVGRQPLDILAKTTPPKVKRKVGRPRKNADEIDRAQYEADVRRNVTRGREAALASSARRAAKKEDL